MELLPNILHNYSAADGHYRKSPTAGFCCTGLMSSENRVSVASLATPSRRINQFFY